jgi:predicted metal-dependent peptidase
MIDISKIMEIEKTGSMILMNKQELIFIGTLFYGIRRRFLDKESYSKLTSFPSGAFTDGETITYLVDNNLTTKFFIFVNIHEILHIISKHCERGIGKNRIIFNLAIDHVVNRTIKTIDKNLVEVPEKCVFFTEIESKHPNKSAEFIYDLLLDQERNKEFNIEIVEHEFEIIKDENNNSSNNNKSDNKSNNSEDNSTDQSDSESESESDSDKNSKSNGNSIKVKIIKYTNNKTGKSFEIPFEYDGTETELKKSEKNENEIFEKSRMLWEYLGKSKGNSTNGLMEYLSDIFKVEVPWDKITEDAILYPVQNNKHKTWMYPNIITRKFARTRGNSSRCTQPNTLIVGIDTSGSVSTEDLNKFVGVILGSVDYYDSLIGIVHDYEIKDEFEIKKINESKILDKFSKLKGRGGTSHKHIFNRIEELYEYSLISTVVFLTDFESDVESIYKDYKWIKLIPTVWVLNSKHEVNLEKDYVYKTTYIQIN